MPLSLPTFAILAFLVIAITLPRNARGEPDRQRAMLAAREGQELGATGQYTQALAKFQEAARLDPKNPAYVCNIGLSFFALQDWPKADAVLKRCYAENGKSWPPNVETAFNFAGEQVKTLPLHAVRLTSNRENTRVKVSYYEDLGPFDLPIELYLPNLEVDVTAEADGEKLQQTITAQESAFGFTFASQPTLHPERSASRPVQRSRTLAWSLVGGGTLLGVAAIASYGVAYSKCNAEFGLVPTCSGNYNESDVKTYRAASWILGTAGVALAATGSYLLFRSSGESHEKAMVRSRATPISFAVIPLENGGGVTLQWQHE